MLALAALYPSVAGSVAARVFASRVAGRTGTPATVASGRAGLTQIELRQFVLGAPPSQGRAPLVTARVIRVPYRAVLGGGSPVEVEGLKIDARRGGPDDNVAAALEALVHRQGTKPAAAGRREDAATDIRVPSVAFQGATVALHDTVTGLTVNVAALDGSIEPGNRVLLTARDVSGVLHVGGGVGAAKLGAAELQVEAALAGMRPRTAPTARVRGGYATPLPTLELTGIEGTVLPQPAEAAAGAGAARDERMLIDLRGSYGGAREALWTASGWLAPRSREGTLSLRAERFSLDKIAEVLPRTVLTPARTTVDARFDLKLAGTLVTFGGELGVAGLGIAHPGLASAPIESLALGLTVRGTADTAERRVNLTLVEGRVRDLVGRLSGAVEMAPGTFTYADGSKLAALPKIDLRLEVPRIPCAKLLASIPSALAPHLEGFDLYGVFQADISAKVDYTNLDATELRGVVGIDGCRVRAAPHAVVALTRMDTIQHQVEVPKLPGSGTAAGETELMTFAIGPENPDYVTFDEISPFLVSSIMTTEDSGFFKHRGWVTSEFKTALRRNLSKGGFRLGASSITMQMVKNVLLSHEKTLSRKLQELFLVWYLEQELPKERILELYFNAIEFGPRIYGIGAATRHYFGKRPSELTPLEAAFFSSILPSPKRRYIQYCHGSLYPPWEKYVRRILARVHERGRITDAEMESVASQTLVFDRTEAMPEKQCLEWVRRITNRPPEPDLVAEADE